MLRVTIDEMSHDLSGYIERVEAGETLVILRDDKPVAEVKPASLEATSLRPFALCAGEFEVPEEFDEPLPEAVLSEFEGR